LQCLVVDDSKSARFTLKRALINLGHEVITVESGEQALEVLCAEEPQVIFMDHLMPGLDGFETSKKIRSQNSFANTPIIMCTAKDSDSYAVEAKKIGLSGTLPKPATEEQIKTLLEDIFADMHVKEPEAEQSDIQEELSPPPQQERPAQASGYSAAADLALNDQLRSLIRAEAEGRARDSAQRLLSDSWGRFRGNLQEDVRQQTLEMFNQHIQTSMDSITTEVRSTINANLSSELRHYVDKKLSTSETQAQLQYNDLTTKMNGLKRQFELQKFDPIALQETILEDARRAAEYTATHKAVDTARKIAKELCEDTMNELLDTSLLENFEKQLLDITEELENQTNKAKTLTIVASFAGVLAVLSFTVAVWALL
tara:strand:- start:40630 stop:41739 length:1110 start_codon:yes stop_codon:yes gene_type:complete